MIETSPHTRTMHTSQAYMHTCSHAPCACHCMHACMHGHTHVTYEHTHSLIYALTPTLLYSLTPLIPLSYTLTPSHIHVVCAYTYTYAICIRVYTLTLPNRPVPLYSYPGTHSQELVLLLHNDLSTVLQHHSVGFNDYRYDRLEWGVVRPSGWDCIPCAEYLLL